MKVCIYLELESKLARSGIGTAVQQQRKALDLMEVEHVADPAGEFDLLHLNTIGPKSYYLANKYRKSDKPVVIHAHTTPKDFRNSFRGSNFGALLLKDYLRNYYNLADLVLCPSQYTKRNLRRLGVKTEIKVISNGVDFDQLEEYQQSRKKYRDQYDLEGVVPFAVGHVFARKGLDKFRKLAHKFPNTDFAWFGPIQDNLLGSAEVKASVNTAPDNLTFTGYVEDIRGAYAAGDIFLFPTRDENQGIAMLEAAACEKPLLLSDIPAFAPLTHRKDCLKAINDRKLASLLKELIENRELRKGLGNNARQYARGHSLQRVGHELTGIYHQLLAA